MAQGDRNLAPSAGRPGGTACLGLCQRSDRRRQSADRKHRLQRSDRLARRVHSPFIPEKCINCGLCDTACPDMVFQFAPRHLPRKKTAWSTGGLTTITARAACAVWKSAPPVHPVPALEKDYPEKPHFLPNQHLLPDVIRYQTVGANSWITSDSFTDESGLTEASYKCRQHQ